MLKTIFKNLLDRRIPQILGVYLGGSWGVLQFVEWLVNRYVLSPYLIDFSIVILVSLIPTVLIVAYLHGKPGRDKWTRVEKIGIPVNLLFTVVLLFLFFHGKNLGAATEKITVENEEGNRVEHVVPKREFRKSVAVFNFENKSGDAELDWLQFGLSLGLRFDLYQDFFLETILMSDSSFYGRMKDAGFPETVGLPFSLERKIAADYYMHYFLTGDFTRSDNQLTVKTALYETERGKLIAERTITGSDIFTLIDRITVQLKADLGLPDYQLQETEDLPVSEVTTNSLDAMKLMTLGAKAMLIESDYEAALQYLEQSVQVDPTCAFAYFGIGAINAELNQQGKALKAFEQALKYKYKLPGSLELFVKIVYFTLKGDSEKAFNLSKTRVELYPDDIVARSNLIDSYITKEQLDEAITEYKKLIEIAPEPSKYYHDIGKIYLIKGVFDEALKYYQRYADEFPDEVRSFTKLAELYEEIGDFQQAKTSYEKALLFEEPEKAKYLSLKLGDIEWKLGHLQRALEVYEQSFAGGVRHEAYKRFERYYASKGQMEKALQYFRLKWALREERWTPFAFWGNKAFDVDVYVKAGKNDEAFQTLKDIEAELDPPFDKVAVIGYVIIYLELEDPDNAEKHIADFEVVEQELGLSISGLQTDIHRSKGRFAELRGKYGEAIQSYGEVLEIEPTDEGVNTDVGRCYRCLGQFRKAEEHLQQALKFFPAYPEAHYEIALVYWDMGKKEKAQEHLNTALDFWKDADAEYKPAKRAREKLAEWQE